MIRRLIVPSIVEGTVDLPEAPSHHVRRVLRLSAGDALELCDGAGRLASAVVNRAGKTGVRLDVGATSQVPRPEGPPITLIQGVAKGEKMDAVIRQATELGVHTIVPVRTRRSVPHAERRIERWRTIAEDALRVSRRAWRPRVEPVTDLDDALAERRDGLALCLALGASRRLPDVLTTVPAAVSILIGPEGGLDEQEQTAADDAGFIRVELSAHTLRADTAGPAVIAMLQLACGEYGPL